VDSHPKIANFILQIFNSPGMNIPAQMAEQVVEAKSWLAAIGQGQLMVGKLAPQPPALKPVETPASPEGADGA